MKGPEGEPIFLPPDSELEQSTINTIDFVVEQLGWEARQFGSKKLKATSPPRLTVLKILYHIQTFGDAKKDWDAIQVWLNGIAYPKRQIESWNYFLTDARERWPLRRDADMERHEEAVAEDALEAARIAAIDREDGVLPTPPPTAPPRAAAALLPPVCGECRGRGYVVTPDFLHHWCQCEAATENRRKSPGLVDSFNQQSQTLRDKVARANGRATTA